jgi:arylsulfatase A
MSMLGVLTQVTDVAGVHVLKKVNRRDVIRRALHALAATALAEPSQAKARARKPNFIVILCDDLGYGDIGAYGNTVIATPSIDRMAREGVTLTDFYAPANVCTPSRAGLLTGRYPIRYGLAYSVILADDTRGLPPSEVTIAKALKPDYTSGLVGKWHLGHIAPFWPPTKHGFDLFFGLPYSHNMLPLSLYEDNGLGVELTKEDVDYPRLSQRFYERAERFIAENRHRPFFLELALSAPHYPLNPHPLFRGHSHAASYGDVVEEVDSIVGRLFAALRRLNLQNDTMVIFTSDNGPAIDGSAGRLRLRKGGASWDGGYRVPFIAWQPGVLTAGTKVRSIAMAIDLLPTFCHMAGMPIPPGVVLDGRDISSVLRQGTPSPHDELLLFENESVAAVRTQRWKFFTLPTLPDDIQKKDIDVLYDEAADSSELYNVADRNPDVVIEMTRRLRRAQQTFSSMKRGEPDA